MAKRRRGIGREFGPPDHPPIQEGDQPSISPLRESLQALQSSPAITGGTQRRVSSVVEQLICNHQVVGSNPTLGSSPYQIELGSEGTVPLGWKIMSTDNCYVLKSGDNQVFGPTSLESIVGWASEAKISPLDKVSLDGKESWLRAPMVPELQMDWLIEMTDNYLYGPTNVATIQEFLATGQIDEHVSVINCRDNKEHRLGDLPFFQASPHHVRSAETTFVGTQYARDNGPDAGLQHRVQLLEKQLMEYQRVVDQWQQAYESLKSQFIEATGREPQ